MNRLNRTFIIPLLKTAILVHQDVLLPHIQSALLYEVVEVEVVVKGQVILEVDILSTEIFFEIDRRPLTHEAHDLESIQLVHVGEVIAKPVLHQTPCPELIFDRVKGA